MEGKMKKIMKDLALVSKTLRQLATKADLIMAKIEKMEALKTPRPAAGSRADEAPRKGSGKRVGKRKEAEGISATQNILNIISSSKEGAGTALLMERTGLKDNNVRAVLSRLSKQGKIARVGRGHYVKV
jgi:hypothetical protein